tara:strand:- start:2376 stop:2858 length:483 start_codon:yes stop_codon:yes gene_type:complete
LDYQKQSIILIALSILIGSIFNLLSDGGISWVAEPIKIVNNSEDALDILAEPSIREVEIETAKALHGSGILFVDARAEEYLSDGFIPGAIASDDISILSNQIETMIGFDTGFVIYCSDDDCGSSEELAYQFQDIGFNNILVFKGGWKSWKDAGLEIEYNE